MSQDAQTLELLRELRDGQREIIALLSAQQDLARAQLERSEHAVAESLELQRVAVRRQRTITLFAVPGILLCIGLIAYLMLRYF